MSTNKLNKFVEEISKLSPLSDDLLLKISTEEIVLLRKITKEKKINSIIDGSYCPNGICLCCTLPL